MTVASIKGEERLDLGTPQEAHSAELGNWLAVEMKDGETSRDTVCSLERLAGVGVTADTENLPLITSGKRGC